jgi:diguanylate cyclase (GGDEF)-like protein
MGHGMGHGKGHDSDPASDDAAGTSEGPAWRGSSSVLDDSIANLVTQMLLAMGGMFAAFAVAELLNNQWYASSSGWVSFAGRGLTFCVLGSLSIFVTSARPIRKALLEQRQAIHDHEAALQSQAGRHRLVARLQAAFDMAESDHDAFGVVSEALGSVCDGPAELLLADSSRAHLRRVASSSANGPSSCGVETPWSCPAVRRSRTLSFADSRQLDACPRLKDRGDGPCSALCVPVTVLGTPMGVLHVTAAAGAPPQGHTRDGLEALAEQAGSRIGVLRAMAASELQATTDPLTGLLNRRSLEAELSRLRDHGVDYSVAFLDLDHFKQLNDTFGHETGDRALRSFARLVRRAVRDADLVCRYGGEEFVVVFPQTDAEVSRPVLERIVRSLADAVASGDVPPFTVSAGLADSGLADDATDVIRHADEAMFRAKQQGRDRIVIACEDDDVAPLRPVESLSR